MSTQEQIICEFLSGAQGVQLDLFLNTCNKKQKKIYNRYGKVDNPERIYRKQFRSTHPDYWQKYYQENRAKYEVKETCTDCGFTYNKSHVKRHMESVRHKKIVKEKETETEQNLKVVAVVPV